LTANDRPIIGIPCRYNWSTSYYELRETYSEALYAAGGIPLLLPLIPEPEFIESVMAHVDAICLSGAVNDVDPLRYGREPKPLLGPVVPRRDETDLMLLAAAEARHLPVLAICFGIQSLNVYRGGTLIQDVQSEVKGSLKHMQGDLFWRRSHSINITEDSLIAKLAESTHTTVNSHHHQGIRELPANLRTSARSRDGLIEAVEHTSNTCVLGIQWHPERWPDKCSDAIMKHFLSAYEGYRSR